MLRHLHILGLATLLLVPSSAQGRAVGVFLSLAEATESSQSELLQHVAQARLEGWALQDARLQGDQAYFQLFRQDSQRDELLTVDARREGSPQVRVLIRGDVRPTIEQMDARLGPGRSTAAGERIWTVRDPAGALRGWCRMASTGYGDFFELEFLAAANSALP